MLQFLEMLILGAVNATLGTISNPLFWTLVAFNAIIVVSFATRKRKEI